MPPLLKAEYQEKESKYKVLYRGAGVGLGIRLSCRALVDPAEYLLQNTFSPTAFILAQATWRENTENTSIAAVGLREPIICYYVV